MKNIVIIKLLYVTRKLTKTYRKAKEMATDLNGYAVYKTVNIVSSEVQATSFLLTMNKIFNSRYKVKAF